jgi:acyl dehydratase
MMYFEDFPEGHSYTTSSVTLDADAIIAFAREHDPQSFHIDPEAAKASPYGGLIASGFHTMVAAFRLTLDQGGWQEASMGSPGMDDIRWLAPVRPGATLHVEAKVVEARPSRSKPDRGLAKVHYAVKDGAGQTVMTYSATHILRRRPT